MASWGSVVANTMSSAQPNVPPSSYVPPRAYPGYAPGYGPVEYKGPYGGYLGSQFDPLFSVCDPTFERKPKVPHYDPVPPMGHPTVPSLNALPGMTTARFVGERPLAGSPQAQASLPLNRNKILSDTP